MAAIGGIGGQAPAPIRLEAGDRHDLVGRGDDGATPGHGTLDRLLNQTSPLDRLVADAGPLGKYRTDQPNQMPSGTSSLTLRVGDSLNRLAARLGLPAERILSGNTTQAPEPQQRPAAELPPGDSVNRADPHLSLHAPRPTIATDTFMLAGHVGRGNLETAGA